MLNPRLWASKVPRRSALAEKPNHYAEMVRVAWQNRAELPFALRILRQGVCDGCALGTDGPARLDADGIAPVHGAGSS